MARWIALLLAGCAESIANDRAAPSPVEEPTIAEECPVMRPGPTFSSAGEPPCGPEGRRCYYGALTCVCRRHAGFPRWACAPDECFAPTCAPGAKCDYGFEDSRICNQWGRWITVGRP